MNEDYASANNEHFNGDKRNKVIENATNNSTINDNNLLNDDNNIFNYTITREKIMQQLMISVMLRI